MRPRPSLLKTAALLAAVLYVAGMTVPVLVPRAHALYWEDDYEGNHPKERRRRPGGFFLFNWIGGLVKKSNQRQYGKIEDRDTGAAVNKGRRATLVVTCGLVGLGSGLLIGKAATNNPNDETSNMFVGGALGFGAGVLIASALMPPDYQVDPVAQSERTFRQAWAQDPTHTLVRSAFRASVPFVQARF
jgi:hypothetical protein